MSTEPTRADHDNARGSIPWARLAAGFLLAPVIGSVLATVIYMMLYQISAGELGRWDDDVSTSLSLGLLLAAGVVVICVVIGIPAFLIATRLGWANLWTATGFGLAIGVVVMVAPAVRDGSYASLANPSSLLLPMAGLLTGLFFWLIARGLRTGR